MTAGDPIAAEYQRGAQQHQTDADALLSRLDEERSRAEKAASSLAAACDEVAAITSRHAAAEAEADRLRSRIAQIQQAANAIHHGITAHIRPDRNPWHEISPDAVHILQRIVGGDL